MSTPSDDARSFWIVGPGRGEIRTETLREPTDRKFLSGRCTVASVVAQKL